MPWSSCISLVCIYLFEKDELWKRSLAKDLLGMVRVGPLSMLKKQAEGADFNPHPPKYNYDITSGGTYSPPNPRECQ